MQKRDDITWRHLSASLGDSSCASSVGSVGRHCTFSSIVMRCTVALSIECHPKLVCRYCTLHSAWDRLQTLRRVMRVVMGEPGHSTWATTVKHIISMVVANLWRISRQVDYVYVTCHQRRSVKFATVVCCNCSHGECPARAALPS